MLGHSRIQSRTYRKGLCYKKNCWMNYWTENLVMKEKMVEEEVEAVKFAFAFEFPHHIDLAKE